MGHATIWLDLAHEPWFADPWPRLPFPHIPSANSPLVHLGSLLSHCADKRNPRAILPPTTLLPLLSRNYGVVLGFQPFHKLS